MNGKVSIGYRVNAPYHCHLFMQADSENAYAVITGAGSGLGKCYAEVLAKMGFQLILISLPGDGLDEVAAACRNHKISCVTYEADLTDFEQLKQLAADINQHYQISVLINNAGMGGTGAFQDACTGQLEQMLKLNMGAPVLLTRLLLPNMMQRPRAWILNVSSMASFSPMGFKTIYPASKKFIQHFTRGLNQEIKDTGVFVGVVHPGPMITNAAVKGRIERQGFFGKLGVTSPEKVAEVSIKKLLTQKSQILVGFGNKLNWALMTMLPTRIKLPLITAGVKKELHREIQKRFSG